MSVVTRATAKTYFETNDTPTQAQFENTLDSTLFPGEQDIALLALQALGSSVKAMTVGAAGPGWITTNANLSDTNVQLAAVYLPLDATITGVKFLQGTQGAFTGDQTNAIGLYSYSGGTLTKQAESANNANIWKGTSNTWQTVAFGTPYAAAAGIYFVALLYNQSAQTTAPALGVIAASGTNANVFDFTNSARLHGVHNTQTTLTATIASSSLSNTSTRYFVALY
jgi:hypothetical protein